MQDEQEPRSDHPAEGANLPPPGIQTTPDTEEAGEHLLSPDARFDSAELESNELHAGGQTCARCGRTFQPGEDVRRTLSGAYQHDFCPPG
jgi:hypothetical protein